jgi:TRAP transporter TAXI family solute receptor
VDITYRIRAGEIDFGNGVAGTDYNNFHGLVTFDGDPNPDARILWYYGYTLYEFVVTKESGVNSFTDLEGKKINDGGTGSSVALQTRDLFQVIGVNPIFYDASKNDAGDAYGNRQIVGMSTSSSLPNAFTMQLNAKLPSKILSMPDDMRKTLIEKFPYYLEATVPAGTYEGMDNDVKTLKFMQGCQSTPKLSQEDAYLIVKAVFGEGKSIWESVTPVYAAEDETELALNSPILLHAGMVQYLKEKGVSVPAKLIPPEYVDK